MVSFESRSPEETLAFGRFLGESLRSKDIVALVGDLAAGKTWLAKGIAHGLGVPDTEHVNSPAYDVIHEYAGRLPVFHMDFYRIDDRDPEDYLWLEEYLDRDGVWVVEWADKFLDQLCPEYLEVRMRYVGTDVRGLEISARGARYEALLEAIGKYADARH